MSELHVWRASLDGLGWPSLEGLPAQERDRAAQMLRPEVARRWVAARWALRHVLARYLDEEPAAIELALDSGGKPRLQGAPRSLHFNLSHSGELALVALCAEHEVGVDVEQAQADRDPLALAEQALGPEDVSAVRDAALAERGLVFHRLWTRHEARLKCSGAGIFGEATAGNGETITVQDLEIDPGYAAAVAVAAPEMPPLRRWTFDPGALQKDGNRVS